MLCQKCHKNQATVHTVTIVNGVKDEKYLCSECAGENELAMNFSFPSMNDFFGDFFEPQRTLQQALKCDSCGTSFEDFNRTGLLGCPECYENFRSRLAPIIKKTQGGNTAHKPETDAKEHISEEKSELKELKRKLKAAIKDEKYEEAAELRDEIRKLEGNNGEK